MNIEEAIEYLKENLKNWKDTRPSLSNTDIVDKDYKAIETLLTAYEKEKEKNKDLKEGYKIQEHNYQVAMEEIEQRWKDKIKAKIEELKVYKTVLSEPERQVLRFNIEKFEYGIEVLQSLLEKE